MQGALQIVLNLVWWALDIALTQLNIHLSEIAKLYIHWLVLYEGSDIVLLLPLYLVWICLTTNMTHDMNNSAIHYSILPKLSFHKKRESMVLIMTTPSLCSVYATLFWKKFTKKNKNHRHHRMVRVLGWRRHILNPRCTLVSNVSYKSDRN